MKTITCPVCTSDTFATKDVIWPRLQNAWQLSADESSYINRQQGHYCTRCNNNLRSMALAASILKGFGFHGNLNEFFESRPELRVLEINAAGGLTPALKKSKGHRLVEYPEFDIQDLNIPDGCFDVVIHSDTLEHIPNPSRALSECYRVLDKHGMCFYTVPMVVGRMTRSRVGLAPSYHGCSSVEATDQLVYTEFGCDAWKTTLEAGFHSCEIFSLEYPAGLAMVARK
jgi:SAM-dependent methyltransferase